MSQDLAAAINDGLYNYEDELWDPSDEEAWVRTGSLHTYLLPPRSQWDPDPTLDFYAISDLDPMLGTGSLEPTFKGTGTPNF